MREKCSYANKYQAIRKPTCGCKVCIDKWNSTTQGKKDPVCIIEVCVKEFLKLAAEEGEI